MTTRPETATIGIAQWLPIPGETQRNEQTARTAVADLAARGADLVVLPEMWLTGYDPRQLAEHSRRVAEPLDGPLVTRLRVGPGTGGHVVRRHYPRAGRVPRVQHGGSH